MSSFVDDMNAVVKSAARRPLWAASWTVFMVSIAYVSSTTLTMAATGTELDVESARFVSAASDFDQMSQVLREVRAAMGEVEAALASYDNLLVRAADGDAGSSGAAQGLREAKSKARANLALAIGTLDGVRFQDARLSSSASSVASAFERLDADLAALPEAPPSRSEGAASAVAYQPSGHRLRVGAQLERSTDSFLVAFDSMAREVLSLGRNGIAARTLHIRRLRLAQAAAVYCLIFTVVVAVKVARSVEKQAQKR